MAVCSAETHTGAGAGTGAGAVRGRDKRVLGRGARLSEEWGVTPLSVFAKTLS